MRYFIFLILCIPLIAQANDTAFGGSGAVPMPIKQANVMMQDEHIVITGQEIDRSDWKGKWIYSCDYTFKNDSNNTVDLQMGFPFPINDELSETAIPQGFTSSKGGALVYNFQVTSDGHQIITKKSNIKPLADKGMYYEQAYLWNMSIPANATIKIHHDYITGVTINSMGQNYVSFVLKTGRLWKDGKITSAKFEVIPNVPTRLCSELNKTADYLAPKPPGITIVGDGKDRRYIWDLQNFVPQDDLELCLMNGRNYVKYTIVNPIVYGNDTELNVKKLSKMELRILRNSIYAQYGKKFQDPQLDKYFNHQWWYEANSNYSDAMLTDDDKKAIEILKKKEGYDLYHRAGI